MSITQTSHLLNYVVVHSTGMNSLSQHFLPGKLDFMYTYTRAYFFSSGHLSSSPLALVEAPLFAILWGILHCLTCSITDDSVLGSTQQNSGCDSPDLLADDWFKRTSLMHHWSMHFRDGRGIVVSISDILAAHWVSLTSSEFLESIFP